MYSNVIYFSAVLYCALLYCAFGLPVSSNDDSTFVYHKRADWGAAPSNGSLPLNTPVPYVVIHHTYIPGACQTIENCSKAMRSMQNYHKSLNWGDIGYNFCIGSEGGVYEGRGWETLGIHTGKANPHSIGICLIGDWRVELPPQVQLDAAKALIAAGVANGSVSPDYNLIAHKQVMPTECPGGALFEEISKWKNFAPDGFKLKDNKAVNN